MPDLVELLQRGDVAAFNAARGPKSRPDLFAAELVEANLAGADLSSANLQKSDLTGAVLRDATLARCDLSESDGVGIDATGAMGVQAKFKAVLWDRAILDGADLSGADFTEASLRGCRAIGAHLDRCRFRGADLTDAVLLEASLAEAKLTQAKLYRADLRRADVTLASMSEAILEGANLDGLIAVEANFAEARMAGASLVGARLQGAILTKADMRDTRLSGADLVRANLAGADLSGADLSGASLADANLEGAILLGARLHGADLTGTDPRVLGLEDDVVATLAAYGAPDVEDAPIVVREPVAARSGPSVVLVWTNADTETLSTVRFALVGPSPASGILPVSAEGLLATLAVARPDHGFELMIVSDRPGGPAVIRFSLDAAGQLGPPVASPLHYPPAVLPVATWSDGAVQLCGFAQRGPTLVVQRWGPLGLEVLRSDRIGNAQGFWSTHHPIVATRGGVIVQVGPRGPEKPLREPAGFPGKMGKVSPTPLGPVAVWFQPSEDPKTPGYLCWAILGGRGEPDVVRLAEGRRVSNLDAVSAEDGVHVAWLEHRTLTETQVKSAILPGDGVKDVAVAGAVELRFAPGAPPALVLTLADGSVTVIDPSGPIGKYSPV